MLHDNKKEYITLQKRQIVLVSIGLGALYWIIDSVMYVFIFHEENLASKIFSPTPYEIGTRLLAIGVFILLGAFAQYVIIRSQKTGDSLRESEKRYRTLAEAAQDMIFIVDRNDVVQYVNSIAAKQFGCKPEELIGRNRGGLFPAEVSSRQRQSLQKVFETGEALYRENKIVFPNKELWIGASLVPIKDNTGKVISVMGVSRDITEGKRIEKTLQESEERYRLLFHRSPVGIFNYDRELRITECNDRFIDILQSNRGKIIGLDMNILKDRGVLPAIQMATEGKEGYYEGIYHATTSAVEIYISMRTAPFFDQKGNIKGGVGIVEDITERKKIEERFFQITHDWEDTFNSITDMVTIHDKDFNIIHANKAAEKILNLPILDITPQKCYRFYHGTDCPPKGCPSCDCLNTGTASTTELYEPHLEKFIEITAIPRFDSSNNVAGLIHIVRDITERKKLEDQLRQSQKMEAIGELAGGIAHDFNNILTAIIGYAHILKLKLKDDSLKINIDQILVSSEKGALLTQSLLAFSRQQVSNPEPVDVNEIVRNMGKLLLSVIGEDIELKTVLTGDLTVMADSIQIDQVLINLCTNARDAMPHGGRLIIETKKVGPSSGAFPNEKRGLPKLTDKDSEHGGEFAEISVSDTGIGMEEKIRERIFEPFFTTKEIDKGTGLGLSIVYGIIKQHNGYIVCESEPGKGTSFKIHLPIIKAEITGKEIEEIPHVTDTRHTILLAEDEFIVRKLTKQVLEEFGYKVIEAVDGEDAVNVFIANKDDIALLMFDIIMPKMSGKEAYDRIRKITPDIKMILTSGYPADFINKDEIIKEGIHFVSKPVSPARLLKKVKEVLSN